MEALYDVTHLSYAILNEQLHSPFVVYYGADQSLVLELVEAHEQPASPLYESFAVIFRGPPDIMLPQAIYLFDHRAIGRCHLFITPIRHDQQGISYEAVFNRSR